MSGDMVLSQVHTNKAIKQENLQLAVFTAFNILASYKFPLIGALGFKDKLVQLFLVFALIFFSLSSYATNDCSDYISVNYSEINRTNMGFKDSLYAELPILNEIKHSDSSEEIVKNFSVSNNSAFTFKVSCNNVSSIFFSVYIGGEKVEFMDGVILLRADNYFSGPHSLVNSKPEVVIIQADKQ